jgi:hypothetical protein
MNVEAVAEELAGKADTITGLTAFSYPVDKIPLPASVVALPDEVDYQQTYGGSIELMVPLFVFVPRTNEKAAAEALAAYLSTSGSRSIKAAVDSKRLTNAYTSCDTVTVTRAVTGAYTYNGVDCYGAEFTVQITGS